MFVVPWTKNNTQRKQHSYKYTHTYMKTQQIQGGGEINDTKNIKWKQMMFQKYSIDLRDFSFSFSLRIVKPSKFVFILIEGLRLEIYSIFLHLFGFLPLKRKWNIYFQYTWYYKIKLPGKEVWIKEHLTEPRSLEIKCFAGWNFYISLLMIDVLKILEQKT